MKGVKFGNYHSYDDFGLILSSKEIGSPEPKIIQIEVEGGDGVLDFTEFAGETKFKNRPLTFHFSKPQILSDFMNVFSAVHNAIHGKKMKIILDDDPGFYYVGRIKVNEFKSDANIGLITVECDCDPWKYKINKTSKVIQLCGRNMLNLSTAVKFTTNGTWTQTETGFDFVRTGTGGSFAYFAIPVKEGEIYSFSASGTTYHDSVAFIVYSDRIYGTSVAYSSMGKPAIFKAKSNGIYIFALIVPSTSNNASFKNVMVEKSTSVGTYEAYSEESITLTETFYNLKKTEVPKIYLQGNATVTSGTVSYELTKGEHILSNFPLKEGNTPITFIGNGVAVVEWQEGGF